MFPVPSITVISSYIAFFLHFNSFTSNFVSYLAGMLVMRNLSHFCGTGGDQMVCCTLQSFVDI